ncbi:MAG: hypothetical protein ACD_40C00332G0002 [uncultured bacterium]|nr:MAG: hypothetical protein ACD_40C00332G0002 [uncultured bacterium]
MNKNISLAILGIMLALVTGLIYFNKDRFKSPLQYVDNKTSRSIITPSITPSPTTTTKPSDLDQEIKDLDTNLNQVNPDELTGSDLNDSTLGL